MTPTQLQSRLRFTARELVTEAQVWPRTGGTRRLLEHASLQLATAARACRPGIPDRAIRGGEALLEAGTDLLVQSAASRIDPSRVEPR